MTPTALVSEHRSQQGRAPDSRASIVPAPQIAGSWQSLLPSHAPRYAGRHWDGNIHSLIYRTADFARGMWVGALDEFAQGAAAKLDQLGAPASPGVMALASMTNVEYVSTGHSDRRGEYYGDCGTALRGYSAHRNSSWETSPRAACRAWIERGRTVAPESGADQPAYSHREWAACSRA